MADLNKQALEMWNAIKPMIDKEIENKTRGMVQRRKAKVTTAPNGSVIGVTEAFGPEISIPYVSSMSSAQVGDVVWIEFMYGATNAFVSMYASADTKDVTVGGDLSVLGNIIGGGVVRTVNNTAPDSNGNVDVDTSGSNANGYYYKFDNGLMVCWKYVTLNDVAMTTSRGSIYESAAVSLGNWPETFIDIPTISLIQDFTGSGAGMVEAVKETSTTFVGNAYFWRATSNTLTLKYRIVGIGRWK